MQKTTLLKGQLTKEELISQIKSQEIKYVTVCIPTTHNVYTKRWEAKYFLKSILEDGYQLPEITLNVNYHHDLIQTKNLNLESTNDINVQIDTDCIRKMSWLGEGHVIVMTNCRDLENKPNRNSPRSILKNLIQNVSEKNEICFKAASELEYYVFNTTNDKIMENNPEINLHKHKISKRISDLCIANLMDRYQEFNELVMDNIVNAGIELEGIFTEYGPGQHEVNIRYNDALKNCDNHILLKRCIKHTIYKKGMGCTFMAKPMMEHDGSSCHVHLSALNKDLNNIFLPSLNSEENHIIKLKNGDLPVSKNLLYFIGGVSKYIKELFLCYAPTVNSYKRFRLYSFAPFYINTWCYDSRFGGIRVIGKDQNLRLEIRFAGADANPYILLTAIIASGMKGIENKIMPRDMEVGDVYSKADEGLVKAPRNIFEAATFFEESEFAKEVFGEDFKEFMVKQAMKQWEDYDNVVGAFEVNRYLDMA